MAEQHSQTKTFAHRDWEIDLGKRELRLLSRSVAIGARAFEVLEVLVEARGQAVDKYELMARIWPGAVVEENTLQFHVSQIRKALGNDRGLVRTEFARGYRLLGPWTIVEDRGRRAGQAAAPRSSNAKSSNLPAAVSELVGRAHARSHLLNLLSSNRIVTLCGTGGIGKTALALDVARDYSATSEADTMMVELAPVSDPALLSSAVATAIGLQFAGYDITPVSVAQALGERNILLLLDNCEHLIDAAAQFVENLVRLCPNVLVVATSREPLRISGESAYQVPPLTVPTNYPVFSDPTKHSAIQLFIARLGAQSDSVVDESVLSIIATICQRLDGIPLAIEFAAARAVPLGIRHVADGLQDRLNLLVDTRRIALPRHQTLRATLDWSYGLLTDPEQRLFRQVAVFPGGFTLDGAAAAMKGSAAGGEIESLVSSLVWKSLLTLVSSPDEPRWRLLETTRAYAFEKLREEGNTAEAHRGLAEFLRDWLAPDDSNPQITLNMVPRHVRELDNVRAALDWAFSDDGDADVGVELAAVYSPVWLHLQLFAECRDRLELSRSFTSAVNRLKPRLRARFLTMLGLVQNYTGVAGEATKSDLAEAAAIAVETGDQEAQLQSLYASWTHEFIRGKLRISAALAERLASVADGRKDAADMQVADRLQGSTYHYGGDQLRALRHFASALDSQVSFAGSRSVIWFHLGGQVFPRARMARTLWMCGFAKKALETARESLEEAQATKRKLSACVALAEAVCPIYLMAGDLDAADESIRLLTELSEGSIFARFAHCLQGSLLIKRGDHVAGSSLLRTALDHPGASPDSRRTSFVIEFTTPHGSGFLVDYANALVSLGDSTSARSVIDTAIAQCHRDGLLWHVPELLRIRGELLMHTEDETSLSAPEISLTDALTLAREQGARYWQLRAATTLAGLKVSRGHEIEARAVIEPICDLYSAEPEFFDLKAARAMLAST